jgi:hypothetical protein
MANCDGCGNEYDKSLGVGCFAVITARLAKVSRNCGIVHERS